MKIISEKTKYQKLMGPIFFLKKELS